MITRIGMELFIGGKKKPYQMAELRRCYGDFELEEKGRRDSLTVSLWGLLQVYRDITQLWDSNSN